MTHYKRLPKYLAPFDYCNLKTIVFLEAYNVDAISIDFFRYLELLIPAFFVIKVLKFIVLFNLRQN